MILIIDNYDSFTWNLVHRLGEIDGSLEIRVERNDRIDASEALALAPSHIIISPGPCTPAEAGNSPAIIEAASGQIPVLGVCLGHQCIGANNGMIIERDPTPMHGKTSEVRHDGSGVFAGLPDPFIATRYHSLVVRESTVGPGWVVSAWTEQTAPDGSVRRIVQGLRRDWDRAPLEGVQFHPESFLTEVGHRLLGNFVRMGDNTQ